MNSGLAYIYYFPPLAEEKSKQMNAARELLLDKNYQVKFTDTGTLSSKEKLKLEQSGLSFPIYYVNGAYYNFSDLKKMLSKPPTPPSMIPINSRALNSTAEILGVSPPGPPNLVPVDYYDSQSDASQAHDSVGHDEDEEIPLQKSSHTSSIEASPPSIHSRSISTHNNASNNPISFGYDHFSSDQGALEEIPIEDEEIIEQHGPSEPSNSFYPIDYENYQVIGPEDLGEDQDEMLPIEDVIKYASVKPSSSPQQPEIHFNNPSVNNDIKLDQNSPNQSNIKSVEALDDRSKNIVWMFDAMKEYRGSSVLGAKKNLFDKTADVVETKARSFWNYLGWSSSTDSNNRNSSKQSSSTSDNGPDKDSIEPPPDIETTFTVMVSRTNWYGRTQTRFLRFGLNEITRIHDKTLATVDVLPYEWIDSVQYSGSSITFRYTPRNTQNAQQTSVQYDFGDTKMTSMLVSAFPFLRGAQIPISQVGS